MVTLPDPENCERCGTRGRVIRSRKYPGYRRRRHKCPRCGHPWTTYQSALNPNRLRWKPCYVKTREVT